MCTPSIPKDNSAELAQQQAAQRESAIRAGQANIDSAFSKFDDNFFGGYRDAYVNNYNPQVDQQYGDARKDIRYDAARKGVLDSTPALFKADRLNQKYGEARQQIASDAMAAENQQRNAVNQQKSQLYALNQSAADPTLAATQAAAGAGTIPNQPQYSALGDLFAGLVNSGGAYIAGQSKAPTQPFAAYLPGGGLPGGNGSGRVVR